MGSTAFSSFGIFELSKWSNWCRHEAFWYSVWDTCVFSLGLWRSLWCDEFQTSERRCELRLAHSWGRRHGRQGTNGVFIPSVRCLCPLYEHVWCLCFSHRVLFRSSSEGRRTRQRPKPNMWISLQIPSLLPSEVNLLIFQFGLFLGKVRATHLFLTFYNTAKHAAEVKVDE